MDEEQNRYTPSLSSASASSRPLVTDSVTCPRCKEKIPLTQALMAEVEVRSNGRTEELLRRKEVELRAEAAQVVAAATLQAEARTKESLATRMADLEAQVREKTDRIEQATAVELELRRQKRELEEKEKTIALQVAREVDSARKAADDSATLRLTEEFRLREAQTKEQLASMTRTIEDLKRKAEQGSQQIQGEAVEVELEVVLSHAFPLDGIAPVAKGVSGADIVQMVRANTGADCAAIVWETKNAKAWSQKWLEKIRDDQREAKADLAVIVTNVMPVGIRNLGLVEGVWVCDLAHAAVLAVALRAQLHAVQRERSAAEGRTTKEAYLYDFVTGNEFQQQVIAVVTSVSRMKEDLDRERNSATRAFAKRDKQIVAVAGHIAKIYGGAQGIIGALLPPVALLEPAEDGEADDEAGQTQTLLSA